MAGGEKSQSKKSEPKASRVGSFFSYFFPFFSFPFFKMGFFLGRGGGSPSLFFFPFFFLRCSFRIFPVTGHKRSDDGWGPTMNCLSALDSPKGIRGAAILLDVAAVAALAGPKQGGEMQGK